MSKETYVYKIRPGYEIRADVYRPAVQTVPSPVLLWIHGGALIFGGRDSIHPQQRDRYTGSGYSVVSIDYRLAPETKLPSINEDIQDAARWVREAGVELLQVDPDRLAVIGHSAGGYLALMAGFSLSPRPKALVSFYGYGDILGDWYTRPDPYYCKKPPVSIDDAYRTLTSQDGNRFLFYLYCRQQGLWPKEVGGHDPKAEASFFRPYCPIQNQRGLSTHPPAPWGSGYGCPLPAIGQDGGGARPPGSGKSTHCHPGGWAWIR